jgi:cell division septation protein DedD
MGPNSFRNLTYAAVLLVVGALVYLIYQSSKKKRQNALSNTELSSGINGFTDTLGSLTGSSIASLPSDSVSNQVDGRYIETQPSSYSTETVKETASEVKDVIAQEPVNKGKGDESSIASSEKKGGKTVKSAPAVGTKSVAPAKKFDAGNTGSGEYLVMAGSFASTDNAMALVEKLKKMGYKNAEAVKLENSANTHVVAGYYDFKGGADAAVRSLKSDKIDAFVKKKSGEIYKATPASTPKSPAKPSAPISKPI